VANFIDFRLVLLFNRVSHLPMDHGSQKTKLIHYMDAKNYKELVKRCIEKKIVTSMTSFELPSHMRVKSPETKTKTKTKTKKEESLSPTEMKEIFNSIINS